MPENEMYPVRLTTPWPGRRYAWRVTAALLCCATILCAAWLTYVYLPPLQQHYFGPYLGSSFNPTKKPRPYDVLSIVRKGQPIMATDNEVRLEGGSFHLLRERALPGDRLQWIKAAMAPAAFADFLQKTVYRGLSPFQLFRWPLVLVVPSIILMGAASMADAAYFKNLAKGRVRRGPRLLTLAPFNVAMKPADGIYFETVHSHHGLNRIFRGAYHLERIAIPRSQECNHFLFNGDTGTGKSQLFIQVGRQVNTRGETAIVYDPTGHFIAEFYDSERGDVILSPMDERCVYWSPGSELKTNAEALTIATSLFPDTHSDNQFFVQTPRQIFAHLIQYAPSAHELADWMANPHEIDKRVEGTELAHIISKSAPQQRDGVLATLSLIAHALRLLPPAGEGRKVWSALEWAKRRKGWVFLRTVSTTREAELPLISMWVDMVILRLMEPSPVPVWIIIDELASLKVLPRLKTAATELRKFNIRMVLGIQARSDLQSLYGEKDAQTIMQMAQTKVFLRLNEPDAADWASRSIGDQEIEHLKISGHQTAGPLGKKSYQYVPDIRTQRAVTKEQIQGQQDLHAYIVHGNAIHNFVLPYFPIAHNVPGLIERKQLEFVPLGEPGSFTIVEAASPKPQSGAIPSQQPEKVAGSPTPPPTPSLAVPWTVKTAFQTAAPAAVPQPAAPTLEQPDPALPSGPRPAGAGFPQARRRRERPAITDQGSFGF